jgi:enoyl-CoA hydratase/carnithine racemase
MSVETQAYQHILVEREGRLALVTMNRPQRRNALSLEHMQELLACFRAIGADRGVGAVILSGNGPAFCAGHDLSEMTGQTPEFYQNLFGVCTELMETIQAIPQPVIAQIHGVATAAGCQLAATCDLVVAASSARFATPGVKIGLFCSTPMVALSRAVPAKLALEMLLTGEMISAEAMRAAGMVNRVVSADQLAATTRALAEQIIAASATVIGLGKQAFYRQLSMPQPEAYAYARQVMASNATLDDAQEGICAFLEKRPPQWGK